MEEPSGGGTALDNTMLMLADKRALMASTTGQIDNEISYYNQLWTPEATQRVVSQSTTLKQIEEFFGAKDLMNISSHESPFEFLETADKRPREPNRRELKIAQNERTSQLRTLYHAFTMKDVDKRVIVAGLDREVLYHVQGLAAQDPNSAFARRLKQLELIPHSHTMSLLPPSQRNDMHLLVSKDGILTSTSGQFGNPKSTQTNHEYNGMNADFRVTSLEHVTGEAYDTARTFQLTTTLSQRLEREGIPHRDAVTIISDMAKRLTDAQKEGIARGKFSAIAAFQAVARQNKMPEDKMPSLFDANLQAREREAFANKTQKMLTKNQKRAQKKLNSLEKDLHPRGANKLTNMSKALTDFSKAVGTTKERDRSVLPNMAPLSPEAQRAFDERKEEELQEYLNNRPQMDNVNEMADNFLNVGPVGRNRAANSGNMPESDAVKQAKAKEMKKQALESQKEIQEQNNEIDTQQQQPKR